ncbi:hypothetical protein M9H77_10926 [Catharanthus roseus]|uniref:Uncharacterized protein n=1 Tax=Catharanthus roseus TaxID=4058 RepID=A0ACC0BD53_CATRO|nr:hypothetical protein M9H77_10926 [Catharanthus roseus]
MRIQGKASEHTMEDNRGASLVPPQPPHVLIFPAPIQGPINSTLSMAELLCIAGFHVTVLVTEDIHSRLQTRGGNNVQSRFERYPGYFQLRTISDGLPEDHPRSYDKFMDLYESLHTKTKVYFKESLTSGSFKSNAWPPVSCIIADSLLRFTYDVAKEIGEDEDALVNGVPGTESFLRRRDMPSYCWVDLLEDSQPAKSVLYVSFGSLAVLTRNQILEFWHGLVNAGKRFLLVMRLESVFGKDWKHEIPEEVCKATEERGYIVDWAPQQEVLSHQAIGAFLTHSGWNSTLEAIYEGVPMICWPCHGDQLTNSRFVEIVWKLGLDMKGACDRGIIEKTVKEVMDVRRDEFRKSADNMAELARNSLIEGGSSFSAFNRLPLYTSYQSNKHKSESAMEDGGGALLPPHVLIFPPPIQGPINSTFSIAELLCLAGFQITVLLTEDIHSRLQSRGNIQKRFERYPNFQLRTISDGLPEDHPRSNDTFLELYKSLHTKTKVYFKEMLTSGSFESNSGSPVSCIIADSLLRFTCDVAKEIGIPIIYLRTFSACCLWVFFCLPKLIEVGEIPYRREDEDALVNCVPATESFLRRRDLPGYCRYVDTNNPAMELLIVEGEENARANGLIINTFEELEGPILSHIRASCPNLYPIGPVHAHLKTKLAAQNLSLTSTNSNILWEEDKSCISWLDSQPSKSVLYVSFGSLAMLTRDQILEFWHGLVNTGKRFLWVIRKDWKNEILAEFTKATEERGCIVDWAPQQEVLSHRAVGAFLTHSGWNSTLESIYEGVPMICWPCEGDQQTNSRFVEFVWKLGLDMKDTCDRGTIEKTVKEIMDVRRDEFRKSADNMAELARNSLIEGGSSFSAFNRLVDDIKMMSQAN